MTDLGRVLSSALTDLEAIGVRSALVGGLAVSVRTEPRFTADVDLAVAVTDDAAAQTVVRELLQRGYTLYATVAHDSAGRMAAARLRTSDRTPLDLLFASSGIEAEVVAAAEVLEVLPDLTAPVATAGHLIALKLLSEDRSRPSDTADLRALLGRATARDLVDVAAAAQLITQRGYARERDLSAALRHHLQDRR